MRGLQELTWIVGRNLRVDYREAVTPAAIAALAPDLVVASTMPARAAVRLAIRTIPILFVRPVISRFPSGTLASSARSRI
jgi:hypothetical protein